MAARHRTVKQGSGDELPISLASFALDYAHQAHSRSLAIHADCFEWLGRIPANSLHAIITDPPYGVKEYDFEQIEKRANGNGGIWRIPPSFDGHTRARCRASRRSMKRSARSCGGSLSNGRARRCMRCDPAATSSSPAMRFSRNSSLRRWWKAVSSFAASGYEPWGILRKPLPPGMTVSECLRSFQTGGLRRREDERPFSDVIVSERTPRRERAIAGHPSLKPKSFLRQIVAAALPLGEGIIADPFMGSGSTLAAAEAMGRCCVGIERYADYFAMSHMAIPKLAALTVQAEPLLITDAPPPAAAARRDAARSA